jgi:hypothetical protein
MFEFLVRQLSRQFSGNSAPAAKPIELECACRPTAAAESTARRCRSSRVLAQAICATD